MREIELIFGCIIDTLKATLGPNSFQTILQDSWRAQFYSTTGRPDVGVRLTALIRHALTKVYGPGSSLSLITEYESCLQQHEMAATGAQARKLNTLLRLEEALGVPDSQLNTFPLARGEPPSPPPDMSKPSLSLARHLLDNKQYALAMQVYSSGTGGPDHGDYVPPNLSRNMSVSNKLVEIARSALGVDDKMALHTIVHDKASPLARHLQPEGPSMGQSGQQRPSVESGPILNVGRERQPPLLPTDPVLARFVRSPP